MKKLPSLIVIAALCMNSTTTFVGDAAAGKVKSATCSAWHGQNGISTSDIWLNLAGGNQPKEAIG